MEFDKSKVYTALNADESLIGAKGYFADNINALQFKFDTGFKCLEVTEIRENIIWNTFGGSVFFYLVEPAPEKYWVKESNGKLSIIDKNGWEAIPDSLIKFKGSLDECKQFIEEHSKPKYRPFRNCEELIGTYNLKFHHIYNPVELLKELPSIWVKAKSDGRKDLITSFNNEEGAVNIDGIQNDFNELLKYYTFLDGSVCGVEDDK